MAGQAMTVERALWVAEFASDLTVSFEGRAALAFLRQHIAKLEAQDTSIRQMLVRWEQQFGKNDGCVRALRAHLYG